MRTAGVLVAIAAACGGPARKPEEPAKASPANQASASESINRARIADDALRSDWSLDYERPIVDKPRDRTQIAKLFADACKAGDHPSCWKARAIVEPGDLEPIAKLVETNCTAGDLQSCRALPATPFDAFPMAPGAAGRSSACDDSESSACDTTALRVECDQGFPRSCIQLMLRAPDEQKDALLMRGFELARQGCDAWILSECMTIANRDEDPHLEVAVQRLCELARSCTSYSQFVLRADPHKARDLYERTCQFGKYPEMVCGELAIKYLDGTLSEPVKGRGQALLDWSCARDKPRIERLGMDLFERRPECKRMTK